MGWIGVDLDGTLAFYPPPTRGTIGDPIPAMAARVRRWLAEGQEVRIFTARACEEAQIPVVEAWLARWGFPALYVTNEKDYEMIELWDDRAVQVKENTGIPYGPARFQV